MSVPPEQPDRRPRPGTPRPAQPPSPARDQPRAEPAPGPPLAPALSGHETPAGPLAARGRPAIPGASPAAPTFEDEVRTAVRYEMGLAVKAIVAIALVAVVLTLRFLFLG